MNRRTIIKRLGLVSGGLILHQMTGLAHWLKELPEQQQRMPVLFMGHGSPMNAIEDNVFTRGWKAMTRDIPKPKAIVCISAHWETRGTRVTAMQNPRMIYDMYGFPKPLYQVKYPAPGSPELAEDIADNITYTTVKTDHDWGFDHGTWSVLVHAFPQADIPCIQLSLNRTRDMQFHYDLAKELATYRDKGVLFVGSGNIVHNLPYIFKTKNQPQDWALEFDAKVAELIQNQDHQPLLNYQALGTAAQLSVNSAEHYLPMLYTLAMQQKDESVTYYNDEIYDTLLGIGMRSFKIDRRS